MTDSNVFALVQPGTFTDRLTDVLREGARALLAQAVEAEVAGFVAEHADKRTDDGRQRLVRHGHLPERSIVTGIGPVEVSVPRVRDRLGGADDRIRFSSAILPPYARRSKSLEVPIPVLYLKGIFTGDFAEALSALFGLNAGGSRRAIDHAAPRTPQRRALGPRRRNRLVACGRRLIFRRGALGLR